MVSDDLQATIAMLRHHLKVAQLRAYDERDPGLARALQQALAALPCGECDVRDCVRPPALGSTLCLGHLALFESDSAYDGLPVTPSPAPPLH